MLIGIGLLWAAVRGKSNNLINALGLQVPNVSQAIGAFLDKLIFQPMANAISKGIGGVFGGGG